MRSQIIAEFASSWNADPELMRAMVRAAAESGADICKLQDYRASAVPIDDPDKARYEKYQMRDELYPQFIKWCGEYGVEPLTSVFNKDRVEFIASLGFKRCKIASICLTNHDLLMFAGAHFDEVILSTAMATEEQISEAADVLATNAKEFTMLACDANYGSRSGGTNLAKINSLRKMLEGQEYASVGASVHSLDISVPKIALAFSPKYLEVHVTLSRLLPQIRHTMYVGGPSVTTHECAYEMHELREIADWRDKCTEAISDGSFSISETEKKIREKYLNRYGR